MPQKCKSPTIGWRNELDKTYHKDDVFELNRALKAFVKRKIDE